MLDWLARVFGGGAGLRKPAGRPVRPAPPPLGSLADLDALIDRCGLGPARDLLHSQAAPCFHLIAGEPAFDAPPGATRLGGAPDLPVAADWPSSRYGACAFLAQFDLADVRARAGANDLPSGGLLSLFVDFIDSAADPVPVRAILTPPGVPLARLTPPADEADFGACTGLLNPVAVAAFVPGVDVPHAAPRLLDRLEALVPDGDIDAFQDGVLATPEGAVGKLFGHGTDHDGTDLRLPIHARGIGRPGLERYDFIRDWAEWEALKTIRHRLRNGQTYTPWTDAGDDDVRFLLANRAAIDAGVEELRLLLTLQSNKAMNLWINDADPIYLFIPEAALARADFSVLHGAVTQN